MTDDSLLTQTNDNNNPDSYWEALTGPGAKFDRTKYSSDQELFEAVGRGKWEADNTITTKNRAFDDLKTDYLKLREEQEKGPKIQEMIDKLSTRLASSDTQSAPEVKDAPQFDSQQIDALVSTKLQDGFREYEVSKAQTENRRVVMDKLVERYGNNYSTAVKQQIDELGVSEDLFNTLAKTNPKLLIKTLGLDQAQQSDTFQSPPRTNDRFAPKSGPKRTWEFYQRLKREQPSVYANSKTQTQMIMDHSQLGNAFEDGDYHSPMYR